MFRKIIYLFLLIPSFVNTFDFTLNLAGIYNSKIHTENCKKDVELFHKDLQKLKLWAVKMFDATSKSTPSGLLAGNTYDFGHYEECLSVGRGNIPGPVKGKYCLAKVVIRPNGLYNPTNSSIVNNFVDEPKPNIGDEPRIPAYVDDDPNETMWGIIQRSVVDPSKKSRNEFWWGICIPRRCTEIDVDLHIKQVLKPIEETFGIKSKVIIENCQADPRPIIKFTPFVIIMLVIISSVVTLVLGSTCYDILVFVKSKKRNVRQAKKWEQFLLCFSQYRNLLRLTSIEPDEHQLKSMHGIKFYTMVSVLLGHRLMLTLGHPLLNPEYIESYYSRIDTIVLLNGMIIVDTFFLIGAFLLAYHLLSTFNQGINISIPYVYIHRWLRIAPTYFFMLGIHIAILQMFGSGPLYPEVIGRELQNCANNWWSNLLFINNYYNTEDLCMMQTWYLSCDMQLFLLAVPLVYLLYKKPKIGYITFAIIFVISAAVPFLITYYGELDPLILLYMKTLKNPPESETFKKMYSPLHVRGSSYVIGIIFGYLTFLHKSRKFTISKLTRRICWSILPIFSIASMFSAWIFYTPGRSYNALEAGIYGSLHRIGWSVGISWVIFGVCTGGKGFVKLTLSMKPLIVLSRLTYCTFLTHMTYQIYSIGTMHVPAYMDFFHISWMYQGDLCHALFGGFFLCIYFEAPLQALEKFLLAKKVQAVKSKAMQESSSGTSSSDSNSDSDTRNTSPPNGEINCIDKLNQIAEFHRIGDQSFFGIPRVTYPQSLSNSSANTIVVNRLKV